MLQAGGLVLLVAGWAVGAGAQGAQAGAAAGAASGTATPHHAAAVRPTAAATRPVTAATPPMGWNSWNYFAGKVTDKDIRDMADLLVETGMRDAGYVYVNIDDTWEADRDAQGNIRANTKFPDMKALADYVHGKGLKIGIYSSPGPKTCADYEGSYKHEEQDARTYAAWGIDYLKYDWCSANKVYPRSDMPKVYKLMADALKATGRPIVFSLCQYGMDKVWEWGAASGGNLWRTTGDISDKWKSMESIGFKQNGLEKYAGPGHWNDPDMLEVGNGKLTLDENMTHMTLWAMLAAPLIAGNNLTEMKPEIAAILMNKEAIAIDQDPLGRQGDRIYAEGPVEIWAKPLKNGAGHKSAVAIFNFGETASEMRGIRLHLKELALPAR
jgi:alpha-galactosidase